ncbi:MAG: hypothetical protein U0401_25830 [Anaerolineae bacterium]
MSTENETLLINPYIAGSPVKDAAMFFGREDVYTWLRQHLRGVYQHNAIVLYGERRSGKTSILYQMKDKLGDDSYIPILLDLQGMNLEGMAGSLWEVARKLVLALRGVEGIPPLERPLRQDFEKDPYLHFEEVFLPPILGALGQRSLLLMFDEANRIAEKVASRDLPPDVFDYLRSLIQQANQVNFLFCLGNRLEAESRGSSQLFNLAVYHKISFLERDFAEALITQPVAQHYHLTQPAVERILQLTSGQPYYTQLLCHNLFTRWIKNKPAQLTVADVDAVISDVIEQGTPNFQFVWEDSTPVEQAVLAALADRLPQYQAGVIRRILDRALHGASLYPSNGDVTNGLRRLFERDIINDQEPYFFRVALMQQWLNKFRRLEWAREELGEVVKQWEQLERQRRASEPTPVERARNWSAPVLAVLVVVLLILIYFIFERSTAEVEAVKAQNATAAAQFEATKQAFNQQLAQSQAGLVIAVTKAAEAAERGNRQEAAAAMATANAVAAEAQQLAAKITQVAAEAATAAAVAQLATSTPLPDTPTSVPPTTTPTPIPTSTSTPTPTLTPVPPTPTPRLTATPLPVLKGTIAYPVFNGQTYDLYFGDIIAQSSRLYRQGASQPAFSPDGSRIAFVSWARGRGIMTASSSGGNEVLISTAPEDKAPVWSPDGRSILFFTRRAGGRASEMYRTQADALFTSDQAQQFMAEGEFPSWSNNDQIVFRGWGITGVGLRIASSTTLKQPQSLTIEGRDTVPVLSPDGKKVVFMSVRDGNWEIYLINADGTNLKRLTNDPAIDGLPTWSPDSHNIAFVKEQGQNWAIWTMYPDGSNQQELLPMIGSPDGKVFFDQANSFGWPEERISWSP